MDKAISMHRQPECSDHTPLILDLADCPSNDLKLLGGKGANLVRLNYIGAIRVPPAVIITTRCFDLQVQAIPGLWAMISELDEIDDPDVLLKQAVFIHETLGTAPLPNVVQAAITDAHRLLLQKCGNSQIRVSVRSSATAEDLSGASFAGQYATYLNRSGLESILDAVRGVWASTFSPNAMCYRRNRKLNHRDMKMAVILQQMVDARVSGTAFTVDLESGLPMIRIHANYGLGEAEVGGTVTPDTWIVDPENMVILKRCLGSKNEKIVCDRSALNTVCRPTTVHERAAYALDSESIISLAHRVKIIGNHYSAATGAVYIDTEFAVDKYGQIFFLQARPETVWSRNGACLIAVNCEQAQRFPRLFSGGFTGSPGVGSGTVRIVGSLEEAALRVKPGDILVVANTTNVWERVLGLAGGVITDIGGAGSHTAIVMREQGKPAIVGAANATTALAGFDGHQVTVDATQKMVFLGHVPAEYFISPNSLNPSYGTGDRETEEESWIEAAKTGQTHVAADGRRWIGKPKHPVGKFMQGVYLACHRWMGKRLSNPVTAEIQNAVHRMDFHELFRWRLALRAMTLDQLEHLHKERQSAVQAYIESCNVFQLTPLGIVRWHRRFVRMNAFIGLAYNIHKVTEGLLEQALAARETPEPFYSQLRSAMGALLGETEAKKELRDYKGLLDQARDNDLLANAIQSVGRPDDLESIMQISADFFARLRRHAAHYKVGESTDLALPLKTCILEVALRLKEDLFQKRRVEILDATPAEFYPDDGLFCRVARLTLESEKARQDAHHLLRRGQWPVVEKLNPLADWLVATGRLKSRAGLFDHSLGYMVRWAFLYKISERG